MEKSQILSYEGAAPLHTKEGQISRAYPTIGDINFPHTPLGQIVYFRGENFLATLFQDGNSE